MMCVNLKNPGFLRKFKGGGVKKPLKFRALTAVISLIFFTNSAWAVCCLGTSNGVDYPAGCNWCGGTGGDGGVIVGPPAQRECEPNTRQPSFDHLCSPTIIDNGKVCDTVSYCDSMGMGRNCGVVSSSCRCSGSTPYEVNGNCVECIQHSHCDGMKTANNIDGGKEYMTGLCLNNVCVKTRLEVVCNDGWYRVDANHPLDRRCDHCSTGEKVSGGNYLVDGIIVKKSDFHSIKNDSNTTSDGRSREHGFYGKSECYIFGKDVSDGMGIYDFDCTYVP